MEGFLFQAIIYLAAAVIAVPIASRLGLGSVLGYLLAGILIGPVFGIVDTHSHDLQHFAEFGVVMMLFLIGLELDPRALWDMRHRLIGMGGMQIIASTLLIALTAFLIHERWPVALAVGMILSLSSTAIVLQTLSEKGLMQTAGGRSIFSVLLTQDVAVIPLLAAIPLLAISGVYQHRTLQDLAEMSADSHANPVQSFIETLPAWGVTLVTLGAVAAVVLFGIYLIRPVFRYIHHARLREMYTALALLLVIGIAYLMTLVGLSPALGTFLAGVVLANSEFRHELESDIAPFKGLLLGLFFITVGSGINVDSLFSEFWDLIGLTLLLMLLKGAILYALARAFKLGWRDRWLFTLGLAQAGEFGFVLTSFALQQNVIPGFLAERLSLIITLSMLMTPLFFIAHEYLSKRGKDEDTPDADEITEQAPVIIAGMGRFGQVVNRMVQLGGMKTVILDSDLEAIQTMRQFGYKAFFGDPTRPDLLHAAGLDEADIFVVAVDGKESSVKLVEYARRHRPNIHIVARAYDRLHVYQLYRAGADDIVREMFDSSLRAGRYVLENAGLSEYEASEMEKAFYQHDRHVLRELATLWKDGIPITQNAEYMARAKELNRELETAFVEQSSHERTDRDD